MTKRLLGAMVLAVGLLVGVVGAADDKSKIPTISDVMNSRAQTKDDCAGEQRGERTPHRGSPPKVATTRNENRVL